MAWPITHMVAPADESLQCAECHDRNGVLDGVEGIYIPGRDKNLWLDRIGFAAVLITLLIFIGHGTARLLFRRKAGD
jgi:hypothetical protein